MKETTMMMIMTIMMRKTYDDYGDFDEDEGHDELATTVASMTTTMGLVERGLSSVPMIIIRMLRDRLTSFLGAMQFFFNLNRPPEC